MKRIFHRPWHGIRRAAGIGAMCLLGLTTLSTSLQAEETLSLDETASELLSFQLTNAMTEASLRSGTLAPAAVQQFAHQQTISLGSIQPSNQGWNDAELDFSPLGPGTHSWLVNAHVDGKPIGYMIITADRSGHLHLSEYGQGEENPYNISLLQQSLKRHDLNLEELSRGVDIHLRYASPLLAYWEVEQSGTAAIYIDATNGDTLPNSVVKAHERSSGDEQIRSSVLPVSAQLRFKMEESSNVSSFTADFIHLQPVFDPADNLSWITSKAIPATSLEPLIKQWKKHQHIVFSADDRNVLYGGPLPVSGYQVWQKHNTSEQMEYVAIGGHSSVRRFVPLDTLIEDGHFYTFKP
ncbi:MULTISPECIES: hypothetical protein [Paenibacillus]|uniref:Uncharacterized protein n=1 Tax=Paenibacillus xylanilyticus TaxID=248903 RepID=A0A7Y6C492_9BACL|nr:hypothetical protein [Paenibacillus xylanilyticus]NUU80292.1 hypothetical protein [Paenibacillus xylanilyticus]